MPLSTFNSDAASRPLHVWRLIGRGALFVLLLLLVDRSVAGLLERGLRRYHGLDREASVLCVGHSRMMLGLDRDLLEQALGVPVAKYAVNGANIHDRFAMIRHYLSLHPGVEVVIYGVEAFTFSDRGLSSNSHRLFEPLVGDPVMRDYVRAHLKSRSNRALGALLHTSRFEEVTLALALRGLLGSTHNLKIGQVNVERLSERIQSGRYRKPCLEAISLAAFEEMIDWLQRHGVALVLLDMPTLDTVNEISPAVQARVRQEFARMALEHPTLFYVDMHAEGEQRYELFYDGIHLNAKGRAVLTARVADAMERLTL